MANTLKQVGRGVYELPNGEKVRGKAKAEAALAALDKAGPNPDLSTTTKKGLDEMSDAHRRHIERWEPFVSALGVDHVWAATPRQPGRGDGPFYLAVKFGAKNYGIVSFDTSEPKTAPKVLVEGITSPKAILAEFRSFREQAKSERDAARAAASKKGGEDKTANAGKSTKTVTRKKQQRKAS